MELDLKDIFRKTFGYEAPPAFQISQAPARLEYSSLGQPYYESDIFKRESFLPVKLNGILIPFAVLSVTEKKTIVSTAMPERSGSVHELVSIDDYQFNIKGLLVDEDGNFPESGIIELHKVFKVNSSISLRSVTSDIFLSGEFDHKVVIKEVKWPASAGIEHAKAFEIDCESDQIFELEIK
jgi:hypothetical protein